jgi:hypothetical protein
VARSSAWYSALWSMFGLLSPTNHFNYMNHRKCIHIATDSIFGPWRGICQYNVYPAVYVIEKWSWLHQWHFKSIPRISLRMSYACRPSHHSGPLPHTHIQTSCFTQCDVSRVDPEGSIEQDASQMLIWLDNPRLNTSQNTSYLQPQDITTTIASSP